MPKLSILTLILNLVNIINLTHNSINSNIINIISIVIFLSMIVGAMGGMNVIKIKTLLAYSSLLNVSYMLLAIISNNNYSIVAYLFYILQYSITHMNIFSIILLLPLYSNLYLYNTSVSKGSQSNYDVMLSKYSPIEYISQFRVLLNKNTTLCICLCISFFSLIGVPPLSGFYGKLLVFMAAMDNGFIFLSLLLVLASSISAYYYGNVIRELCFDILNNYNSFKYNVLSYASIDKLSKLSSNLLTKYNIAYYNNINNGENSIVSINNNISYLISVLTLIIILIVIEYDNIIGGTYLVILGY